MTLPPSLLTLADASGWQASLEKSRELRSDQGQFFTPPAIARSLAGWFSVESFNQPNVHVLDPGAGGGALTAAVVERLVTLRANGKLPALREVILEVWELDESFHPTLSQNLAAAGGLLSQVGIHPVLRLHSGNYIEAAVRSLEENLFDDRTRSTVTHAILNPPYRKIATRSKERAWLGSVGIETSNLYAAFVALAVRQLTSDGELTAITPRSFCNGPYFREFRRELLSRATFHRVHLFDSRSEAFSRDQVLQENILFHLRRETTAPSQVMLSNGPLAAPLESPIPYDRFVSPVDPDRVIHLATETDACDVRGFFEALPCRLPDLNLEVSTGPVVDFRLKEALAYQLESDAVPLLYPHAVKAGTVSPPRTRSTDYPHGRLSKKAVAIRNDATSRKWLLPVARFVLIKRFSAKEEKRRLVAGVLNPDDFSQDLIGIENHLNFFHHKRSGLPLALARGLSRFLNSTVADRYFRQFNGHTQVNASDLRALRYPDAKALERLGSLDLDDTQQHSIDLALTELLGAPSFAV
jgi:adenine-specific DNA-methyltransferase